jgi:hypothetical protein
MMIQIEFDFDSKHAANEQKLNLPWSLELPDGRKIETMILGGCLANARCAGAGERWHAVVRGRHPEPALCGQKPGRRSMGWFPPQPLCQGKHDRNVAVNCPRCLSKIAKIKS